MAKFIVDGLEDLIYDFEQLQKVTDDEWDEILIEEANYLADQIQMRGQGYGVGSGKLLASIKPGKPKAGRNGGRQIVIAPRGKRTRGKEKIQTVTNAEIAFYVNYGSRGTEAKPFWTDTVEISRSTIDRMTRDGLDRVLKKRNL